MDAMESEKNVLLELISYMHFVMVLLQKAIAAAVVQRFENV